MKKVFFLTTILFALAIGSARAQRDNGDRMAQMKQKLKTDLKFTDIQADSVVSIQQEFGPQRRAIFQDQTLAPDDKKAKMKDLMDQSDGRIKTVLGDSLFNAYKDYRLKNRPQGMRGAVTQ